MASFRYLPAKKTRYKGRMYRSKTEALWAMTLCGTKLKVQYETKYPGVYYLPDFLIGEQVYVEVKPNIWDGRGVKGAGNREVSIPAEWMEKACALVQASGRPLIMVFGEPTLATVCMLVTRENGRLTLDLDAVKGSRGVRRYLRNMLG